MQRLAILRGIVLPGGPDPTGSFQHGVGLLWVVARFQANIGVYGTEGAKSVIGHLACTVQRIVDQRFLFTA